MPATQFDAQPAPSLPMDIVHRIASFLSPREWARGPVLTCRDFNAVSWDALELDTTWASPGPPPRWLLSRWAASRSLMIIDLEFKGSATLLEALASASAAPNLTQLELFTNNFPWSATDTSMRTKLGSGAPRNALTMLHPLLPALRELTAPVRGSAGPAMFFAAPTPAPHCAGEQVWRNDSSRRVSRGILA